MPKDTDILLNDLDRTKEDSNCLISHVKNLDASIDKSLEFISIPKNISDNISKIDDDLNRLENTLSVLSLVPVVDEFAGPAKISVSDTCKMIHPIRVKANEFDDKVKPIRVKLKKIEKKVKESIKCLENLKKTSGDLKKTIEVTDSCAKKQNRHPISLALDGFSNKVDPGVKGVNRTLILADRITKDIDSILSKLSFDLEFMSSFNVTLESFQKEIDSLSDLLIPIQNVLNKKIGVPYSVKIKVHVDSKDWWKPWSWGWKPKTVNFNFNIQQILDGVNTGIGWVNDQLMDLAKNSLKEININLPKLNIIPGINDLSEKITDAVESADGLILKFDRLDDDLDKIILMSKMIQDDLNSFDIICA